MKKPYLKKIFEKNNYKFFYVDGMYVRKNLDEEFTNFGDNHNFKFIPENEVWIDKEFGRTKELKYLAKFFIDKINHLARGRKQKEAIKLANVIEQKERDKNPAVNKLKKLSRDKQIKIIHKRLLKRYSNKKIKVWIVDGFLVRSLYFLDFTEGGHDYVYKFIPKNEIWIDDALNPKEIEFVLLHEAHERRLMTRGMSYSKAHKKSSRIELYYRKNPRKMNRMLRRELKMQK